MASASPLFTFDHARLIGPNGIPRLADATGEIAADGVTVIVGPSGSGKSSLLRLCNRLEVADEGTVRFWGQDVREMDPLALRHRVGMVFQTPTPFAGTVRDNLQVARAGLDDTVAHRVLGRVGLDPGFLDRPAAELSGGEAQRMCLARTLVTEPEVLLLDEPTSSLDPKATVGLEELARQLRGQGVVCIWVTHDLAQMQRLADRVLVVLDGVIAHSGRPAGLDLDAEPKVAEFLHGGDEQAREEGTDG